MTASTNTITKRQAKALRIKRKAQEDAERRAKALLRHRRGEVGCQHFYSTTSAIEARAAGGEITSDQVEIIIEDVRRYMQSFLDLASQEDEWRWLGYLRLCTLAGEGADNPLSLSDGSEHNDVSKHLIASACGGDVSADASLCRMGAVLVRGGYPLPPRLRWYVSTRLKQAEIWPDCHADGRPSHIRRDLAITVAIDGLLIHGGFDRTRNESKQGSEDHSACSIVAAALDGLGIELGESSIEKIWKNHRHLLDLAGLYAQPGQLRMGVHTLDPRPLAPTPQSAAGV